MGRRVDATEHTDIVLLHEGAWQNLLWDCIKIFFVWVKHIYLFILNVCIYFWLCWVSVAVWAFLELPQVRVTLQLWRLGFPWW